MEEILGSYHPKSETKENKQEQLLSRIWASLNFRNFMEMLRIREKVAWEEKSTRGERERLNVGG